MGDLLPGQSLFLSSNSGYLFIAKDFGGVGKSVFPAAILKFSDREK